MIKFTPVEYGHRHFPNQEVTLPTRSDKGAAGYDFYSNEDRYLLPGTRYTFWTDIKAYMPEDVVLYIYTRSGNGVKHGIILRNSTGVIDSTYAGNPTNDGNIGICLINTGDDPVQIKTGDRIAQGVFQHYLTTDDDRCCNQQRLGGFGSSGR